MKQWCTPLSLWLTTHKNKNFNVEEKDEKYVLN
jgi:hypothetical protein